MFPTCVLTRIILQDVHFTENYKESGFNFLIHYFEFFA